MANQKSISSRTRVCLPYVPLTAAVTLLAIAGAAGYQQLFSSFAPYDDEGYLMISLSTYLAGHPLYDDTYTQYGPAFYALNGLFHAITGLPVTHDVVRIKTLVVWLATAAMCAGLILRITRSKPLACVALLAVFFHLDRLGLEPGHPQDICLLTISATLLLGSWIGRQTALPPIAKTPRNREGVVALRGTKSDALTNPGAGLSSTGIAALRGLLGYGRSADHWLSLLLGALAAIAIMTKINIGGLLFLGIGLALLAASPPSKTRVTLLSLFVAGALGLPWLLARQHVFELDGWQLPVVAGASVIASLIVVSMTSSGSLLAQSCWWWFVAGFGGGCLLFAATALAQGTSPSGLLNGLLLQHLGFMEGFYENPPIYHWAGPSAVLAVLAALAAMRGWSPAARLVRLGLIVMLVGVCLRHLGDTFIEIQHGANDRGQAALLVSFCTPLLWLLFLPYREAESRDDPLLSETRFARLLLCTVGLLQPLGVYPVPGTQMALGSLALLLALLVCLSDVLRFPATLGANESSFRSALAGGLVCLVLLTGVCRGLYGWQRRALLTPTRLAGAERLCLPADFVAQQQWTVQQLRLRAETFICMQNGHNSLYAWSQLEPPTAINTTLWQDLLDDAKQQRIVDALTARTRACVVVDHNEPPPRRRDGPLTRFVLENFRLVARRGSTEIWAKRAGYAMTND